MHRCVRVPGALVASGRLGAVPGRASLHTPSSSARRAACAGVGSPGQGPGCATQRARRLNTQGLQRAGNPCIRRGMLARARVASRSAATIRALLSARPGLGCRVQQQPASGPQAQANRAVKQPCSLASWAPHRPSEPPRGAAWQQQGQTGRPPCPGRTRRRLWWAHLQSLRVGKVHAQQAKVGGVRRRAVVPLHPLPAQRARRPTRAEARLQCRAMLRGHPVLPEAHDELALHLLPGHVPGRITRRAWRRPAPRAADEAVISALALRGRSRTAGTAAWRIRTATANHTPRSLAHRLCARLLCVTRTGPGIPRGRCTFGHDVCAKEPNPRLLDASAVGHFSAGRARAPVDLAAATEPNTEEERGGDPGRLPPQLHRCICSLDTRRLAGSHASWVAEHALALGSGCYWREWFSASSRATCCVSHLLRY